MTIEYSRTLLAVAAIVLVSPNTFVHAAGIPMPRYVPWEDRISLSQAIVVGEVESVEVRESTAAGRRQRNVKYEIIVREVLYGTTTGRAITCHDLDNAAPTKGDKLLVFLSKPQAAANAQEAEKLDDVQYMQSIDYYSTPRVVSLRRIVNIYSMSTLDEQVAAVKTGCLSANREFRRWCLSALVGGGLSVHKHIEQSEARKIITKNMMIDGDDHGTIYYGDYLLRNDRTFQRSDMRYNFYLRLFDNFTTGRFVDGDTRFPGLADRIYREFPSRADSTVDRLEQFVRDPKSEFCGVALIRIGSYFASGNDQLQNRILALTQPHLYSDDESLNDSAGIAIGLMAIRCARRGTIPARLRNLMDNTDKMTERARKRIVQASRTCSEIVARRSGHDKTGGAEEHDKSAPDE